MNKKKMKIIEKEIKKDDLVGVTYQPTLEECDYLYSKGIATTKSMITRLCLVSDYKYLVNATNFVKEC